MIQYLPLGSDWEEVSKNYRMRLFVEAGHPHHSDKAAMDSEWIKQVLGESGELCPVDRVPLPDKYFAHGGILGPKSFVAEMAQNCGCHGNKGPCELKEAGWEDSATLRKVRGPLF
jgi:hypothetical protein